MRERSWGLSKYLWRLGDRGGEGEGRMGKGEGRRVGLELELAEGGREEGEVAETRGGVEEDVTIVGLWIIIRAIAQGLINVTGVGGGALFLGVQSGWKRASAGVYGQGE